jgi:cyclopropane-fatty-acyl-phospholipid synthase
MVTRHSNTIDAGAARTGSTAQAATLQKLLEPTGVHLNGKRAWDVRIRDARAIDQILRRGSLGAGEAYMRGWWDAQALDECIRRIVATRLDRRMRSWRSLGLLLRAWLSNPQRVSHAFDIGEAHYDLGNNLFQAMLDRRLVYSCAYWRNAESLDAAQEHKLDLICRKLGLQPGQRLLDIGCGWGSLCRYAAENYGVQATGITVSEQQQRLARTLCAGLPVEIRLQDYRDLDETFDHVASVGMFEHVGAGNYDAIFDTVRRSLRPGGLFLLHTIGSNISVRSADPWIERYIFPRGHLPSLRQLAAAAEDKFVIEDLHNFGADYDRTLMAWFRNFHAAWDELSSTYSETFYRMWKFYLLSCAGAFRARTIQLWQLVLSADGVPGGYRRIAD